jgi:hypothetical protein
MGLLSVGCILVFCRYFWDEKSLKQYEEQLKDLKTEESTKYSKAAKGKRGRQEIIMLDNKRKFPRSNFVEDVEFNASGVPFSGITKDVSHEGISFISQSCNVDVGSPLQFQMQDPQGESTIEACGDITWKRKIDDEWHLGLRFRFINKVDNSDILDVAYATG